MNIQTVSEIIIGAIVLGIVGFVGWLWKQSIYGRFETIEGMIMENRTQVMAAIEKKMDRDACGLLRDGCTGKFDELGAHISEKVDDQSNALNKTLDLINSRLMLLIQRLDKHIDGK